MRGHSGKEGLVPVNYIDKLDTAQEKKATDDLLVDGHSAPQANGGIDSGVCHSSPFDYCRCMHVFTSEFSRLGTLSFRPSHAHTLCIKGEILNVVYNSHCSCYKLRKSDVIFFLVPIQALAEVLKSIDSNIQRIHEAATAQGNYYTADQRSTLE